ncbi:MAG: helix-turn-helix domain-containing protein [Spirillospora sp.]
MPKKKLAAAMGFDPSYISHVEAGRHSASEEFARKAEAVLSAGGALWHAWWAESPVRIPGAGAAAVDGLVVGPRPSALRRAVVPAHAAPSAIQRRCRAGHAVPDAHQRGSLPRSA